PDLAFVDHSSFALLSELKLSIKAGSRSSEITLFDGEIVELEPFFSQNSARLIVRAFDRLHKLTRGQHARTFQNVTDSDLVSKIAGECGLSASATATTEVHKHCFQANQSNLDFLRRRLARVGHLLSVDGKTLKSGPPAANPAVSLSWGTDMIEFRPRMSVSSYTTDVSVRSWDMKTKKAIVGKATTSDGLVPAIGATSGQKPSLTSELLISDCTVNTQAEATSLAKSYLQHRNSEYVEAEGTALGNAKIKAGERVEIQNVGTRFSGTYLVTAATHRYTAEEGYSTDFSVTGLKAGIIQDLVGVPAEANTLASGMMIGLVTNNKDPEKFGRVKVKFPWLSEEDESDWLRVVVPGGDNNRGLLFLPEVNDEVLVGFEQGDINRPYVLGGLWNGQDATICVDNTTVKAGKVEQRLIVSRTGHKIVIDDSS
ncbi:MAG TPA: VgrG-related protein, partial [Roseiflexaceae bacterium]|nr:VgrG-related protein [Roseiflexaceae bacterium]